jgi:hypothetical protein
MTAFMDSNQTKTGEYDGIHGFQPDQDGNEAYLEGYRSGYEYAQKIGANQDG